MKVTFVNPSAVLLFKVALRIRQLFGAKVLQFFRSPDPCWCELGVLHLTIASSNLTSPTFWICDQANSQQLMHEAESYSAAI